MKAIYLMLGEKVYRLNQDTRIPNVLEGIPTENKSSINTDEALKTVVETIQLSTMETSGIKTNGQKYIELKDYLISKKITQIYNVYNRFKIAIDYSLNNGVCELSRNIVIKDMTPNDAAILLGVGTNSELIYRRAKDLRSRLDFGITVPVPLGVVSPGTKEYRLHIHDITFYVDSAPYLGNVHNSIYETPCGYSAHKRTISQDLTDFVPIYSTSVEGLEIQDLKINFMPRKVSLDILLTYAGLIVAYNDAEINEIIKENIRRKYHPDDDPDVGPIDPVGPDGIVIPDTDDLPDADGSRRPNRHGWYDYWEKCSSTNPYAKLVVEDMTPDSVYDQKKMVKKSKVIKDIPDVEVGDYVHYVEVVDDRHNDWHAYHHHHHHCHCNDEIHVIPVNAPEYDTTGDEVPAPTCPSGCSCNHGGEDVDHIETETSPVIPDNSSSSNSNEINALFAHLGTSTATNIETIDVSELEV